MPREPIWKCPWFLGSAMRGIWGSSCCLVWQFKLQSRNYISAKKLKVMKLVNWYVGACREVGIAQGTFDISITSVDFFDDITIVSGWLYSFIKCKFDVLDHSFKYFITWYSDSLSVFMEYMFFSKYIGFILLMNNCNFILWGALSFSALKYLISFQVQLDTSKVSTEVESIPLHW